jgi:hypothetical protein
MELGNERKRGFKVPFEKENLGGFKKLFPENRKLVFREKEMVGRAHPKCRVRPAHHRN